MKRIGKIENVNIGFQIIDDSLIVQIGDSIKLFDIESLSNKVLFKVNHEFHTIKKQEDETILISHKGYQIFNNELSKFYEVKNGIGDYTLKQNRYLSCCVDYDYVNYKSQSGCIDVYKNEIIWKADYGENLYANSKCFFSISNNKIRKRKTETGVIEWEYNFDNSKLIPSVKANNNFVLILIEDQNQILCLDAKTGDVNWISSSIAKGILIDESGLIIHQFMVNYIQRDALTGNVLKKKIDSNYFYKNRIENQKNNFVQFENSLILNDSRSKVTGKFDLKSLEFDWIHEGLSIPEGYSMKVNKAYIFLLDDKKNLNIFKKET